MNAKKPLVYIISILAALAVGAALFFIMNSTRNKEFISSVDIDGVRARSAFDPTNAEDFTDDAEMLRIVEFFNSLELKEADNAPSGDNESMISLEFSYKNGSRTTVYRLGSFIRLEGGEWLEIVGGDLDELEAMLDTARFVSLRGRFPQYFDIGIERGIDVYAWKQDDRFVYGIAPMASLPEKGEYPTSLAPLEEDELLMVLKTYESYEIKALISKSCLLLASKPKYSYTVIDPAISSPLFSLSSSIYVMPVPNSNIDSSSFVTWSWGGGDSGFYERMIELNPLEYERGCIRLLPILDAPSEESVADYNYLKSLFESDIAPLFAKYVSQLLMD